MGSVTLSHTTGFVISKSNLGPASNLDFHCFKSSKFTASFAIIKAFIALMSFTSHPFFVGFTFPFSFAAWSLDLSSKISYLVVFVQDLDLLSTFLVKFLIINYNFGT